MDIIPYKDQNLIEVQNKETYKDNLPKYLTKEEVNLIISLVPEKKFKDKMFLMLLWNTGIRVSEALEITKEDIDFSMNNIRIHWLKRRKKVFRSIPINKDLSLGLALYTGTLNQEDRLFKFNRHWAYKICKKYGTLIGKKIHPHTLRHSFAIHYLKNTNDLNGLKELLGHKSIFNTLIYTKLTNNDLREKLNKVEF